MPDTSFEALVTGLTAALNANTAALTGKPGTPAAASAKPNGATPTATAAPTGGKPGRPRKVTFDQVKTMAYKVRDEKSKEAAQALIAELGVTKLAELPEDKYAEFIKAAEVALADEGDGTGDDDEI